MLTGMVNNEDHVQTAPTEAVRSGSVVFIWHFVRNFGVRNFRTVIVSLMQASRLLGMQTIF